MNVENCEKKVDEGQLEHEKKKLALAKVLELLIPKVQIGRLLPEAMKSPPWRLPAEAHAKSNIVNDLLSQSMAIQSSKVPGSDDFENFIISNACLAVSGLLRY